MSSNNRFLGRTVLLATGLFAIGAGAALLLWTFAQDVLTASVARASAIWPIATESIATPWGWRMPVWGVAAVVAALLVLLISVAFIASRRRGTTRTALRTASAQGTTSVDATAVGEFFALRCDGTPELLDVSATTYSGRRGPTILMELFVRDGADLSRTLAVAHAALADWDNFAGTETPVVLRVGRQRVRDRLRAPIRAR